MSRRRTWKCVTAPPGSPAITGSTPRRRDSWVRSQDTPFGTPLLPLDGSLPPRPPLLVEGAVDCWGGVLVEPPEDPPLPPDTGADVVVAPVDGACVVAAEVEGVRAGV